MVRRSSPPSLFFSCSVSADPPLFSLWCRPLVSRAAMFFCYHQRDKWETREEESLGARVLTSSPPPPSLPPSISFFILHLSVFLSDSWQPVGYSRHANPSADICQLTWENTHFERDWLMRASPIAALFFFFLWTARATCNTHHTPRCPRSFVAIKTCNSTSFTGGLETDPLGPARRQRHIKEELIRKETISRGLILYLQWFINPKKKNQLPIRKHFMMKMFVFAGPGSLAAIILSAAIIKFCFVAHVAFFSSFFLLKEENKRPQFAFKSRSFIAPSKKKREDVSCNDSAICKQHLLLCKQRAPSCTPLSGKHSHMDVQLIPSLNMWHWRREGRLSPRQSSTICNF